MRYHYNLKLYLGTYFLLVSRDNAVNKAVEAAPSKIKANIETLGVVYEKYVTI